MTRLLLLTCLLSLLLSCTKEAQLVIQPVACLQLEKDHFQVGELVPIINCSHSADFVGLYIYDEKDEDPGFPIAFTNVDTLRLTFNYPGVRVLKVEAFNGVGKKDLVEVERRIFIGVP